MNVFIHGWSFSKEIWKQFFHLENSKFFELPFHGELKNFKKKNLINNYLEFLNKNINEPSTLIGWSLGASVSVLFYLKYPKKVKKLILIGFSPKFKDKTLGHNPVAIKAFLIALKIDFKDVIYKFRKSAVKSDFKEIPLPEKEGSVNLLKEYIELDLTHKIENIKVPTFLIHGKKDKIINYKASIFSKDKIKNSDVILLDSHHAPFLEKKEIILDLI